MRMDSDGVTDIPTTPGLSYMLTVSGGLGGGVMTLQWGEGMDWQQYPYGVLRKAGSVKFVALSHYARVTLSGSAAPDLGLEILRAPEAGDGSERVHVIDVADADARFALTEAEAKVGDIVREVGAHPIAALTCNDYDGGESYFGVPGYGDIYVGEGLDVDLAPGTGAAEVAAAIGEYIFNQIDAETAIAEVSGAKVTIEAKQAIDDSFYADGDVFSLEQIQEGRNPGNTYVVVNAGRLDFGEGYLLFPEHMENYATKNAWNETISGVRTFSGQMTMSGQVTMSGQSASSANSAMTRQLVDTWSAIWSQPVVGNCNVQAIGTGAAYQNPSGAFFGDYVLTMQNTGVVGSRAVAHLQPFIGGFGAGEAVILHKSWTLVWDQAINTFNVSNTVRCCVVIGTTAAATTGILSARGLAVRFTSSGAVLAIHNGTNEATASSLMIGVYGMARYALSWNASTNTLTLYYRFMDLPWQSVVTAGSLTRAPGASWAAGTFLTFINECYVDIGGSGPPVSWGISRPKFVPGLFVP